MNLTKQQQIDILHLDIATSYATQSKAVRNKVGALIVTRQGVIVPGYNGTPPNWDNTCETYSEDGSLITKPEVVHAELNAIFKCAKEGISTLGATAYVTLSPCVPCSSAIACCGFERVVYKEQYRILDGIQNLIDNGHSVTYLGEYFESQT